MTVPKEVGYAEVFPLEARSIGSFEPRPVVVSDRPADQADRGANGASRSLSRSKRRYRQVPIVIIDKSALIRAGLAHVLAGGRFRVAADCSTLCDLPESALNDRQCVALICPDNDDAGDISLQIAQLKGQADGLRIIVLAEQFRPEELLAVIEAGADGYLIKSEITPEALVQSLELVLLGGVVIPHGLSKPLKSGGQLLDQGPVLLEPVAVCAPPQPENGAAQSADLARLSNREQMILKQLTQGASNKLIARELNIAEATVKVHVKSLLRKIRVSNRTQAAMWAIDKMHALLFSIGILAYFMQYHASYPVV